jgi:hypothetical protein
MDFQDLKSKQQRDAKTFKKLTGVEAQHLKKTQPDVYQTLRDAAQAVGLIGAPGYRQPGLHVGHYVDVTPPPSTEEIKARIRWTEAECRKFYANEGNADPAYDLAKLARENPTAYESVRLAAQSYAIIERSSVRPQRRPVDAQPAGSENPIILGERLAKLTGYPATTEISATQLFELIEHANAVDAAKAQA